MSTADKNKLAYIGAKPGDNRDSDSWFTPEDILTRVRYYLDGKTGQIDFDPFSSPAANQRVKAVRYFTKDDDAIKTPWPRVRTVFMNPPYGRGLIHGAINAFVAHLDAGGFERGLVLVNNATETSWYYNLRSHPDLVAVCLPFGRIAFENLDGKRVSGNTRGQSVMMFDKGNRREAQKRARTAFESDVLFPFRGFVDTINKRNRPEVSKS